MSSKRFWQLAVGLSVAHAAITFVCLLASIGSALGSLDHKTRSTPPSVKLLERLLDIDTLPGRLLCPLDYDSKGAVMAAMAVNSCLWGFGLAFVIYCLAMRFSQPRPADPAHGG